MSHSKPLSGIYLTDCTRIEAAVYPLKIAALVELQKGMFQLRLEDLVPHDYSSALCANHLLPEFLRFGTVCPVGTKLVLLQQHGFMHNMMHANFSDNPTQALPTKYRVRGREKQRNRY